jgi:thiol-disulfide isomerase/thioredoxin
VVLTDDKAITNRHRTVTVETNTPPDALPKGCEGTRSPAGQSPIELPYWRTIMSLQDKLDAFKADFKAGKPPYNAPPEIHPIMERATSELIATGQAGRAIKAGDLAPTFRLKDQDGNEVSSASLLEKGPLVVTFYRGVWCPYCNMDLQAIEAALPEFAQAQRPAGRGLAANSTKQSPFATRKPALVPDPV